jgi:hypothetical protein
MARILIKSEQLKILSFVLFVFFLGILAYKFWPKPIYSVNYKGEIFNFRVDLREASKIPSYPNQEAFYELLISPSIENITIAFVPVEGENGIYVAEAFELTYKLSLIYKKEFGKIPKFNGINISSYENVELYANAKSPYLVLVHPRYANETSLRLNEHAIFISGKSEKELDLATAKLLMICLGIRI